jgi:hypothetical protein
VVIVASSPQIVTDSADSASTLGRMDATPHNEEMIAMTEPQIWTMIGAFAALMFGMMTMVSTVFIRVLRAELGGLRAEMNSRFEIVGHRIDGLDRDVQALVKRTFGLDRE